VQSAHADIPSDIRYDVERGLLELRRAGAGEAVAVGCGEGQELLFRAVLALKHASKALKTAQKNAQKNRKTENYATMAAISSDGLGCPWSLGAGSC
jgi:hypothetical protein